MKFKWTGYLGVGILLIATTVFAQPETNKPDAEVGFRRGSQLTGREQLVQSDKYMAKMKEAKGQMERLVGQAKQEKDIIKVNCVNDKISQTNSLMTVADESQTSLKSAVARSNQASSNHEFSKLTITYQKVTLLAQEAEACIGEEISYVGETQVETEVDKNIPQEDPTVTPPAPLPAVRPPLASPFS